MNEHEAARRVINFLMTLSDFRKLLEGINRDGDIPLLADGIADAIKVQE